MGHHYVPRFYLNGFSQRPGNALWAYDRQNKRKFKTNIRNLAQQTNYYPEELEAYFSNDVEGPTAAVIRKIRSRSPISSNDRRTLARYLISQWKRVPKGKQRVHAQFPRISEEVKFNVLRRIDELVAENPHYADVAARRRIEVDEIIDRYRQNPPDDIWFQAIGPEFQSRAIEATASMFWRFFCIEDASQFLTSDNPVFIFESKGVGNPDSELSFPIAHDTVLWASWSDVLPEGYLVASRALVKEFNRRTASYSTRFVFAKHDEPWIHPFVFKGRWRLNWIR